jgi:putative intracellular protease/amidase
MPTRMTGGRRTTFFADGRPVTGDNTLVVHPHHSMETVPALDVLVHPGGDGHIAMLEDEAHLVRCGSKGAAFR